MRRLVVWDLESARNFLRPLSVRLKRRGFGLALGGSVLTRGESAKDLDIVVFPLDASNAPPLSRLHAALLAFGLTPVRTAAQVQARWRDMGSTDTKHVEEWRYLEGSRVDVFFLT